ncbi:MAG: hypothetical protein Q8L48_12400 [Archangium sp.]|nr:hypothetical protein [Archangium sp.]
MASSTRTELSACLVLVLFAGTGAHAQVPDDAEARAAALLGRKAFEAGDFDTAILRYEEARQLKAAPGLLFNLAQSHRRAGHLELAVFYFRGYLESDPPEHQARVVEALLQRVQTERQLAVDLERLELERTRVALAQSQLSTALCAELPPAPPPITSRWWFWGIVGAVATGTVVAVAVAASPHPAPTTFTSINAR